MKRDVHLNQEALTELRKYLTQYPEVIAHELDNSGINPLMLPHAFMQYEILVEPEHADVLNRVRDKKGLFDKKAFELWKKETERERKSGWTLVNQNRLHGSQIHLDDDARKDLQDFFARVPNARQYESHEHGLDVLLYPDQFVILEFLGEQEHANLLRQILKNQGRVTTNIVKHWIDQEFQAVTSMLALQQTLRN